MIALDNLDGNILNSDYSENMKKVIDYLKTKHIPANSAWVKERVNALKNNKEKIEEEVYKLAIQSDLAEIVDKEQIKDFPSTEEKFKVESRMAFMQINGYANIAESKETMEKKKGESLLDVLENFESKFLQSEEEEVKKTEKTVLKFEFTDGKNVVYGFEYEDLKDLRNELIKTNTVNKFPKVLIGPNFEFRRGIIYLRKDNIKLL